MDPSREQWPAWATAAVEVVAYDPAWEQTGATLVAELGAILAPWLLDGVHHVGSTAVVGLAAKPIIDVMAGVHDLAAIEAIATALGPASWNYVSPELDQRTWRRFFVLADGARRISHLHVMCADNPRWQAQLLFRDRLRESGSLRLEYARLKERLARRHTGDREAYTNGKSAFVTRVLRASKQPSST